MTHKATLDVPAHPEGVKAAMIEKMRDDPFIDDAHLLGTTQQDKRMEHYAGAALSALSHPEPVAQETAAETLPEHGPWARRAVEVVDSTASPTAPFHPSPSPEQGEDDLVQRLLHPFVYDNGELDDDIATAIMGEAATELSTLRARVAELEARATPQAGASEAGPVATCAPDCYCALAGIAPAPECGPIDDWNRRASALPAAPMPGVKAVEVSIKPMRLSDDRCDYFVSFKCDGREVTPHVFRERFKAEYHVAEYRWLFGQGPKPVIMEFRQDEWPAREFTAEEQRAFAALSALDVPAHPEGVKATTRWVNDEDERESFLEAMVPPDNAPVPEVLAAILVCANAWVPEARIIGNVRAGDIARAVRAALSHPEPVSPSSPSLTGEELVNLRTRLQAAETALELCAPVFCGQNKLFPPERVGCGKPILHETDVFRCTDCATPFHRGCAKAHFGEHAYPRATVLSHPEPVAQEAVDLQEEGHEAHVYERFQKLFDRGRAAGGFEGETQNLIRELSNALRDAANWRAETKLALKLEQQMKRAHPSPSPEQGDDLVQRLTEVYEHDWRISFLAHTSDTAREAAAALSTLRARVAELEASATPQAGASEAEPVAWMRDYPDMTCLTTTKPEPPEPGWRDIWMPLYATPPDSDAVRALREIVDGVQEWCDAVGRGTSWDYWDHHYKHYAYNGGLDKARAVLSQFKGAEREAGSGKPSAQPLTSELIPPLDYPKTVQSLEAAAKSAFLALCDTPTHNLTQKACEAIADLGRAIATLSNQGSSSNGVPSTKKDG